MKTSVISVRLPESVATELKTYCKGNNTNISKYLQDSFTDCSNISFKQIDQNLSVDPAPDVATTLIGIGGGSVAGILAYKGVKTVMVQKGFPEEQAEIAAFVAGVAGALVIGGGLYKVLTNK